MGWHMKIVGTCWPDQGQIKVDASENIPEIE